MTLIRLGYVAMSNHVPNCSSSQTMTYTQFSKIKDRDAAIRKLETPFNINLHNCWRLLIHSKPIIFSSLGFLQNLSLLANHPEIPEWDYIEAISEELAKLKTFIKNHPKIRSRFFIQIILSS